MDLIDVRFVKLLYTSFAIVIYFVSVISLMSMFNIWGKDYGCDYAETGNDHEERRNT